MSTFHRCFTCAFATALAFTVAACSSDGPSLEERLQQKALSATQEFINESFTTEEQRAQLKQTRREVNAAALGVDTSDLVDTDAATSSQLSGALPTQIIGLPRLSVEPSSNEMMGSTLRLVDGTYGTSRGESLTVQIADVGEAPILLQLFAPWRTASYDRSLKDGFSRTATFDGQPALEQKKGGVTSLGVVVNNRYVVSINSANKPIEQLRAAFAQLEIGSLPD